jgi:histidinol-phosphate aminotransferase
MDFKKFILPHIWNLKPYSSARDEFKGKEGVFLDANENPLGSGNIPDWNRYPDPMQWNIKHQLAEIKQCNVDQIFLGNGSDEAIDLLIRMTCDQRKDHIIICPPTYGMYEVSASVNNVQIERIDLTADYQLNVDEICAHINENSKLIFICSPNNPTGNKLNRESIYTILDKFTSGFVIVDEAYFDFSDEPSFITELSKFPNLIVMQTLSKAYGLASLRLGMAFAHPIIIQLLNKIKPPYNISGATQSLVEEALKNKEFAKTSAETLNSAKKDLISNLRDLPQIITIYPSNANFILVKCTNAQALFDYLIKEKIITRNRSSVTLCDNSIRISIGLPEENNQLIKKIKRFYA